MCIKTWIEEYLNNRQLRVKANNTVSEMIRVEAEVMIGRVLGPILFRLFISDINKYMPLSPNLTKFYDDVLTYERIFNRKVDHTRQAVYIIQRWAEDNKMRLNMKKTKHISVG